MKRLSEQKKKAILNTFGTGRFWSVNSVAKKFGVGWHTVQAILNRSVFGPDYHYFDSRKKV